MRWRARRAARDVSVQGSGLSVARGSRGPHARQAPTSAARGRARRSLSHRRPRFPPDPPHTLARRALFLRVRAARRRRPRRAHSSRSRSRGSVVTTITTTCTCVTCSPGLRTPLLASAARPFPPLPVTRHIAHANKIARVHAACAALPRRTPLSRRSTRRWWAASSGFACAAASASSLSLAGSRTRRTASSRVKGDEARLDA